MVDSGEQLRHLLYTSNFYFFTLDTKLFFIQLRISAPPNPSSESTLLIVYHRNFDNILVVKYFCGYPLRT